MQATTKQLTLRLPPDLYAKSMKMARRHKISLNRLARRGLEHLTARERSSELRSGYDLVGFRLRCDCRIISFRPE